MKSFVVLAFGIKMPSFAPRRGGNVFAPTLYMPQVLQYYRVARKMTHTLGKIFQADFLRNKGRRRTQRTYGIEKSLKRYFHRHITRRLHSSRCREKLGSKLFPC